MMTTNQEKYIRENCGRQYPSEMARNLKLTAYEVEKFMSEKGIPKKNHAQRLPTHRSDKPKPGFFSFDEKDKAPRSRYK